MWSSAGRGRAAIHPVPRQPHVKMTTERRSPSRRLLRSVERRARREEDPGRGRVELPLAHGRAASELPATLVAGEFSEIEAKAGSVPLTYSCPKVARRTASARSRARRHDRALRQPHRRAFPWNKYARRRERLHLAAWKQRPPPRFEHICSTSARRLTSVRRSHLARARAQWFAIRHLPRLVGLLNEASRPSWSTCGARSSSQRRARARREERSRRVPRRSDWRYRRPSSVRLRLALDLSTSPLRKAASCCTCCARAGDDLFGRGRVYLKRPPTASSRRAI